MKHFMNSLWISPRLSLLLLLSIIPIVVQNIFYFLLLFFFKLSTPYLCPWILLFLPLFLSTLSAFGLLARCSKQLSVILSSSLPFLLSPSVSSFPRHHHLVSIHISTPLSLCNSSFIPLRHPIATFCLPISGACLALHPARCSFCQLPSGSSFSSWPWIYWTVRWHTVLHSHLTLSKLGFSLSAYKVLLFLFLKCVIY